MFLATAARSVRGFVARPAFAQQLARPVRMQSASMTTVEMFAARVRVASSRELHSARSGSGLAGGAPGPAAMTALAPPQVRGEEGGHCQVVNIPASATSEGARDAERLGGAQSGGPTPCVPARGGRAAVSVPRTRARPKPRARAELQAQRRDVAVEAPRPRGFGPSIAAGSTRLRATGSSRPSRARATSSCTRRRFTRGASALSPRARTWSSRSSSTRAAASAPSPSPAPTVTTSRAHPARSPATRTPTRRLATAARGGSASRPPVSKQSPTPLLPPSPPRQTPGGYVTHVPPVPTAHPVEATRRPGLRA